MKTRHSILAISLFWLLGACLPFITFAQNIRVIGNVRDSDVADIDSIAMALCRQQDGKPVFVQFKDSYRIEINGNQDLGKLEKNIRDHLDDPERALKDDEIAREEARLREGDGNRKLLVYKTMRPAGDVAFTRASSLAAHLDSCKRGQRKVDVLVALNAQLRAFTVTVLSPTTDIEVLKCVAPHCENTKQNGDGLDNYHARPGHEVYYFRLLILGDRPIAKDIMISILDSNHRKIFGPRGVLGGAECTEIPVPGGVEICIYIPRDALFATECQPENDQNEAGNVIAYWRYYLRLTNIGSYDVDLDPDLQIYFSAFGSSLDRNECPCKNTN